MSEIVEDKTDKVTLPSQSSFEGYSDKKVTVV